MEMKFERRRFLNWFILGLTYSAMYFGRYNLSIANPLLSEAYGWNKVELGSLITPALLGYGFFAIFNGIITDHVGGRRGIIIGALGAFVCNFLFALGGYLNLFKSSSAFLTYLTIVWVCNSYFQSFCAVSVVKVNTAWYRIEERGLFSAAFGSMVQIGRLMILFLGPLIAIHLGWVWLFFIPSFVILGMAVFAYLYAQNSPESCGYKQIVAPISADSGEPSIRSMIIQVFTSKITIAIALAEFCSGFVRHGFEQWFPRYLIEVQQVSMVSLFFRWNTLSIVLAGILGSISGGLISDKIFSGRRPPVAAFGYLLQIVCLSLIWQTQNLYLLIGAFFVQSFSNSMIHSILTGTASMDFGGRRASATAAGLFDGMQYIGGSLVGLGMGWILEKFGWSYWSPSMIGFSSMGFFLMLTIWKAKPSLSSHSIEKGK